MNFAKFQASILKVLKDEVIKKLLGQIIGKTVGFKAWLIGFIAGELWDRVAVPIIQLGIRKGRVLVHVKNQKIIVKKIKGADTEHDFDSAVDDIK